MSWALNVLMASTFCMGFFLAVWIIGRLKDRRWTKDQQDLWAKLLETYHLVLSDDVDRGFHDRVAALYHYPECWDTMAYPTLYDAVFEVRGPCTTCEVEVDS